MKGKKLLYLEIAKDLKKAIMKGIYEVGALIPSETELEEKYEVSKITIRRAVEILSLEGYVIKKSGVGTTVISNRPFNQLSKAISFSHVVEKKGHKLTKKVISVAKIEDTSDLPKELQFNKNVMKLVRIYYLDDQPYIVFKHFLPFMPDLKKLVDEEQLSLYSVLQENNYEVIEIKDSFSVTQPNQKVAELLEINKAEIILKRERYSYGNHGELVEYSTGFYNVAIHPYEIDYEV